MDEKKKFTFTVILGIAGLWFIFTNFCLPTLKDNTLRLAEYRKLKEDARIIKGLEEQHFKVWDEKLSASSANLEKRFLGGGKIKLAEELTRLPENSNMIFLDIKQRESQKKQDYEIFPVDINMKTEFLDLIRYLAAIESSPLFIGVQNLDIAKSSQDAKDLDVKLTFAGFRLIHKTKSVSSYLEERFKLFNEQHFKKLIEPVASRPSINANLIFDLYNPFISVYDSAAEQNRPMITNAEKGLSLRGTLRIAGKNAALINDAIVHEGDRIDGMEVVQIRDGMVVLIRSGRRQILKMGVEDGFFRP